MVVAWEDRRDDTGEGYNDLYYDYLLDGGLSWASRELRLDGRAPASSYAANLNIALYDGSVLALWLDGSGGPGDIYFQRLSRGEEPEFVRVHGE